MHVYVLSRITKCISLQQRRACVEGQRKSPEVGDCRTTSVLQPSELSAASLSLVNTLSRLSITQAKSSPDPEDEVGLLVIIVLSMLWAMAVLPLFSLKFCEHQHSSCISSITKSCPMYEIRQGVISQTKPGNLGLI